MIRTFQAIVVGAAMSAAAFTQAHALNARTWISGTGTDSASCGPIATPCRTLQWAHDHTAANGEIDVKDSAGYGSVTITQAISIVGDGVIAGVLASSGENAITINAGTNDEVLLRGLTVEGANIGLNGIAFNSGASLTIDRCTIQNFSGGGASSNGVLLKPRSGTSKFLISNSTVLHNAYVGIYYFPGNSTNAVGKGTIVNSVVAYNRFGISVNTSGALGGHGDFKIANTVLTNNGAGLYAYGAGGLPDFVKVGIESSQFFNNDYGLEIYQQSAVTIGRSTVVGSDTAVLGDNSTPFIGTYGDNHLMDNKQKYSGIAPSQLNPD